MADIVDGEGGRWWRRLRTQHDELERGFVLHVETEQAIHRVVDESGVQAGSLAQGGGDGQEIGQHRSRVPEEMTIAARLVLPRVSPVDGGQHDGGGGSRDAVVCRALGEGRPYVAVAQPAQREIAGAEVIEPTGQSVHRAGRHVDLGLVERARRRRRPEQHLAPGIGSLPGHASAVIEERRQRLERERSAWRRAPGIERDEGIDRHRIERAGKRDG